MRFGDAYLEFEVSPSTPFEGEKCDDDWWKLPEKIGSNQNISKFTN
jgi:hypothetical protein